MASVSSFRRWNAAAAVVVCTLSLASFAPTRAEAAEWPANVRAIYDIDFNGINVGAFEFKSNNEGSHYNLTGLGKLSLLLGAFKWNGETQAAGRVVGEAVRPQSFAFSYNGSTKAGSTRLSYTDDTVTSVLHDPPAKPKEGVVPVLPHHLKGVLDPLTAVMAVSKGAAGNPCSRRIPVYDGKARFDLMMSPKGAVQLQEQRPSGQPDVGYVCRVKYIPIAGHKIDQESKHMAETNGIEIILRPVPSANVFVPYSITIPTIAGSARLVSRRVEITTANRQQIALLH